MGVLRDSRTVDCAHLGPLHTQQQVAASIETLGVEYMIVTCFGCCVELICERSTLAALGLWCRGVPAVHS